MPRPKLLRENTNGRYYAKEAAATLRVHSNSLRLWADAGLIPVSHDERGWRFWTGPQIAEIRMKMT